MEPLIIGIPIVVLYCVVEYFSEVGNVFHSNRKVVENLENKE